MANQPISGYQVTGTNDMALFTLKVHRGDGMALLGMNWKNGKPTLDFVGFSIEYMEPGGTKFYPLRNRISFPDADKSDPNVRYTLHSPLQVFRWVHFPRNPEIKGLFTYIVKPVFMNKNKELSYGESQQCSIALARETYPDALNVTFTRGFISSQAFVDRYEEKGDIKTLLPAKSTEGLDFKPTHPLTKEALKWMGFEAYDAILKVLDDAIKDKTAKVSVIAYDLNQPEIVTRLKKLKKRLRIIIDNSKDHGEEGSAENEAEEMLKITAGDDQVIRQKMGSLQHNKTIVVDGTEFKKVVCGSTNLSWRGIFVQNNNAIILSGDKPVELFNEAFENFWSVGKSNDVSMFNQTKSPTWQSLDLPNIDAQVTFSPHSTQNAVLQSIGEDVATTKSSLLYSMAFLAQTGGAIKEALTKITEDKEIFVYGIADKPVGGITLKSTDGNPQPVSPAVISENIPEPFKKEPVGGSGIRMHHKFLVLDFNTDDARVYMGSYNFSGVADSKNGENLLLIKDRKVATSYMIEALRIFDHYEFRLARSKADAKNEKLELKFPPKDNRLKPWWDKFYSDKRHSKDRELFS
ncbi:Phosphatidylserine/phosphatidylglycerophosphate/cardiolipin synthase [Flavobacterium resistens]|uniref:phospholipase D n=1 Tax=Flavobacterium resistens TaxID=443612 RepID=A0A521D8R8_9FLAO|nr:phospholipase D-like domain-containing protein [Flavobacterium resistens]MRX70395.1 phospholipase [Flavobacterium resistens]SMO68097.1 Phosphatidylserine/phosphatidylglycerophosphate/cardiolipin synthase [Flavobacterium resistens]